MRFPPLFSQTFCESEGRLLIIEALVRHLSDKGKSPRLSGKAGRLGGGDDGDEVVLLHPNKGGVVATACESHLLLAEAADRPTLFEKLAVLRPPSLGPLERARLYLVREEVAPLIDHIAAGEQRGEG